MQEELNNLKNQAIAAIMEAKSVAELEQIRIDYLGRNGKITTEIKKIKKLKPDEKKNVGRLINEAMSTLAKTLAEQKLSFSQSAKHWFDATIPGEKPALGHLHLVTQAATEVTAIFEKIGFTRVRYPEVEWDWYAFEALNMPQGHPARDEWETFFINLPEDKKYGKVVLTPHTSSGQIREMERVKARPPIRMINIAKCYRRQSDATHVPMFHQFEGLVVDKGINITNLKGTLDYFGKKLYGSKSVSRIRPFNFKFTEPSFEVDFRCVHCDGKGCKFCKSGWHEVGGAGMVHPNVLKAGGIDPGVYSGFAFGWGLERVYLLKPGLNINDIRTVYRTNLAYLEQL
ncbi:phenylalanine--tRNA ligase subunit alpha [Candidatus Woesebacteria bacterium RIFCSPHIGHO2_01_FULL_44_10]|nr:MAG: phenylalanine--tRNA ligase subunit alpha [Candidatus Woesebacteria bacterium RIFCSPHIGHO2_01_FULL_44_10]OGM56419.1 MAG: phenylalanine--tRNA ligase subunit alpha [Candidatus Woesebacteria bacterium RIFCSPHIGHO2_12_FULL_44_11]